ncbi:hypothetical protein [Asticcacaulis machinosus]|uniref:Uncharacterized protein n=1 Tax=Asticcacaulis machinosus TaxID=2984211 RepID=A0ABT5HJZ3_9CAUL|nr:hypothetical protein [Asticcacaulis machinosus]MDC7676547.1 hypothetical protein [Asticcacaulis machinosus]
MFKRLLPRPSVMQRVALGGLIGAGMALAAIALGKRLKSGALDAPHDPASFICRHRLSESTGLI